MYILLMYHLLLLSYVFQVSWVRHSDTHLLTIGRLTYTSDYRFKAIHKLYSEDYLLQIKELKHRDAGQYECQISTTPPTSHIITLAVAGMSAQGCIAVKNLFEFSIKVKFFRTTAREVKDKFFPEKLNYNFPQLTK